MKERQDSLAARIADTISGGVRRRAQDREPRAILFDAAGEPRILPAGGEAQAELIEAAERLVEIVVGKAAAEEDPAAGDDTAPADVQLEAGADPDLAE
ncbi:MAG: hypothetical protein QOD53_984 [Thermoleophilaceae bacterium]|nr:hypothetical protein [Thermoleophilaceae bacterium]